MAPSSAILVHGTTKGPESFDAQRELAADFRLVLFARRGYGDRREPPQPPGEPTANTELGWPVDVPDLIQVMEREGGAHLVGHSYGGPVVATAASRRPDLVRSLVLLETALGPVAAQDEEMRAVMERERALADRRLELDARRFSAEWMAVALGAPGEHAQAWIATWDDAFLAAADVTRREAWWGAAPVDLDVLARIDRPKVVAIGASRPPFGPDTQPRVERIARATAVRIGARLEVFPGSTHFPTMEEPEAFNALLRRTWTT